MGIYLNPNNENFQEALDSKIYVDKSLLLAYTNSVLKTKLKYVCVSRPRRFGKSMALDMLAAYYGCGCDSSKQFEGLKIAGTPDFDKHLNKYNVIFLNIRDYLTEAKSMEKMIRFIEEDILEDMEREFSDMQFPRRRTLMKCLESVYAQYHVPFVFLIDEWDSIFRVHQHDTESQKQYLDFLRNILKDKSYVALAYMTGILPIKKYGEHSAINVFYEYSMIDAQPITEFTGFTEAEVQTLCLKYNMSYEETKRWYDGYDVDGMPIYNPKSVVEAMLRRKFNNYWTKTETYEALKVYIQANHDGLQDKVAQMIAGGRVTINPEKFVNDMVTFHSADDVLTLLVHLGYLTFDFDTKQVWIPNGEVRQEFINSIEDGGWETVMKAIRQSDKLLQATLNGEEDTVAQIVQQVHEDNISILQYNNENALSCVVTLAYYTAQKEYTITREAPAGKGYADLLFTPRRTSSKPAFIVELKWGYSPEEAIEQIRNKNYVAALKDYSGEILLVGICYEKEKNHSCKIERTRND